jgi:hypothetical protein
MLQFAAPIGLLALGALLAPVLIHLVRRPRRVVKIGSLRSLEGARRQIRSLRWEGLLLLALRCALLAALALSLAGVRWQPRAPPPARWLLVVPGASFDPAAMAEWERLRGEGFEPHALSPGFPSIAKPESTTETRPDVWSLLRELELTLPNKSQAVVFGSTTSTQFRGPRPTLSNVNVRWHATPSVPLAPTTRSAPRVAMVVANDRAEDARYVRAALTAIGATIVIDGAADWIVQLGPVALPGIWNEQVTRGAHLITDAPDHTQTANVARWFDVGPNRVRISRRVTIEGGTPWMRDSAGEPLVTKDRQQAGTHWRFALRFHPDWSDWPLETAFPAWWREQLNPPPPASTSLAPEQAAPAFAPDEKAPSMSLGGFGRIDLRGWAWLLAATLFAIERLLSWRSHRRKVDA